MFKLGLVINPVAGIGGTVAFKGSDGLTEQALALGAELKANDRAKTALRVLVPYKNEMIVYTVNNHVTQLKSSSIFNLKHCS